MTPRKLTLEPELEALLNPRKIDRVAPAEVRARALARGHAIVAAGGRIPPGRANEPWNPPSPSPSPALPSNGNGLVRGAWVASAAVAVGVTAAVLILRGRPAPLPKAAPAITATETAVPFVEAAPDAPPEAPTVAPEPSAPTKVSPPLRGASDGASFNAEVELLARAQAAYTRRDFSRALALVSEHARRFPSGHLSEEREALRVRSLVGSGRSDDARRVSAAFAARFPRSVLLPRVEGAAPAK
jgi:hypothetical protein